MNEGLYDISVTVHNENNARFPFEFDQKFYEDIKINSTFDIWLHATHIIIFNGRLSLLEGGQSSKSNNNIKTISQMNTLISSTQF